jgi:hypothetical protein
MDGLPLGRLALAVVLLSGLAACSKINICGQEDKLVGTWTMTSFSIDTVGGDSIVNLMDTLVEPAGWDTTGLPNAPRFQMDALGNFRLIQFFDTIPGIYRMERYERKCLLYIDLFEFRWQVTSISDSKLEISSFFNYTPKDTVTPTEIVLEK